MDANQKTIFIIGAGAIGKALSVFLKQQDRDVVLLRGHVDDNPTHIETIEVELSDDRVIKGDIPVSSISNYPILDGQIVVTTKSYGNRQLAGKLKGITGSSPIIILQNGLDVERSFIDQGFSEIYRCVLFV